MSRVDQTSQESGGVSTPIQSKKQTKKKQPWANLAIKNFAEDKSYETDEDLSRIIAQKETNIIVTCFWEKLKELDILTKSNES